MITEATERAKYEKMWGEVPAYRASSPGERLVPHFLERYKPPAKVIDIGCGPGRATKKLFESGFDVVGFDIAKNCLDPNVDIIMLFGCIWEYVPTGFDLFYCTDVCEHIPPDKIDFALDNIMRSSSRGGFFNIALFSHDIADEHLHLTVENWDWWTKKLLPRWGSAEFREIEPERLCAFVGDPKCLISSVLK